MIELTRDGWVEGRKRGRKKASSYACLSSGKQIVSSLKEMFSESVSQYFDNHARNGNLSEGSFFLPFKGK